jgi:hypothetical protein
VLLEVEVVGDGEARDRPLHHLVAQPQTTKVFERCVRCLCHLDGDKGDDLLWKTVPSATDIGPLRMLHDAWMLQSGMGKIAKVDVMGSLSRMLMCI